jgi:hypothetical protein
VVSTISKNFLGSAPLRCPCGRLNHQKHRAVSTRARIRSRARCGGKVRIRHLLDRDLADRVLSAMTQNGPRVRTLGGGCFARSLGHVL